MSEQVDSAPADAVAEQAPHVPSDDRVPRATNEVPKTRNRVPALLIAVACAVFGAKLMVISALGSPMPLLDQWDAEASRLYSPYLKGVLSFADLFAPHNEHRIFVARVLALVHLELAGHWDTRLEMIVGAVVHTAAITWLAALLMPLVAPHRRLLFACFVAWLFAIPIGYENELWGFQCQLYLALLFGIATLVGFATAPAFSARWFGALTAAVLGCLSFGVGVAAIVAAGGLVGLQLAADVRKRCGREFVAIAVMVSVAVAMVGWEGTAAASTTTPWAFAEGLCEYGVLTLAGVAPMIWYCRHILDGRPAVSHRAWVALGIGGWLLIQLAMLAYGRGTLIAVRYLDIVLLAYPLGLVAVFALADGARSPRSQRYARRCAAAWMFIVVAAIAALGYCGSLLGAVDWSRSARQQQVNAQAYLETNDIGDLRAGGGHGVVGSLAYPNPQRLARILGDPDVRAILPVEIRPSGADNAWVRSRLWLRGALAGATAGAVGLMLAIGPALLALGVTLLFACGARRSPVTPRR
ncbi:hypothetical protein [Mycobacterium parmense]|uniref:Uncharacterized protein n=1 Tax=Mycobacterium parmense TaxID=185642 RepID=A0A7I7YS81_9MYCO|nr:hypothetical protein [Mycobacterium parmense]MCV7351957.1 hypothetical protein [Mycobacterium parmense]ORW56650.1 hypothetical protein AWC20_02075 [Mycobacterium parmense]BBZ44569.1 hypothetical protein MPRM_18500 [Mycobacterium parmense]